MASQHKCNLILWTFSCLFPTELSTCNMDYWYNHFYWWCTHKQIWISFFVAIKRWTTCKWHCFTRYRTL